MKKIIEISICALLISTSVPAIAFSSIPELDSTFLDNSVGTSEQILQENIQSTITPTFNRTWGSILEDYGRHTERYKDYFYSAGYHSFDGTTYSGDAFLIKWDTSGSIIWNVTFTPFDYNVFYYVTGYQDYLYTCGYSGSDIVICKYDLDANLIWSTPWDGGTEYESFYCVVGYENHIYVCGRALSQESGTYDALLLKYDLDGNLIWENMYDASGDDSFSGLTVNENGIYVCGYVNNYESAILFNYDFDGELIFKKYFDDQTSQIASAVVSHDNYIYVTGGIGEGFYGDLKSGVLTIKCDMNGNTEWMKTWDGGAYSDWGYDLDIYEHHMYVTGRQLESERYYSDVVLLKYDLDGNLLFDGTWANPDHGSHEYGRSIQVYKDYIYISGGTGVSSGESMLDFLLLKCDVNGEKGNTNPVKPEKPDGPQSGKAGEAVTYTVSASDPDGEQVKFLFDWGDGNKTWSEWSNSGEQIGVSYSWAEKGNYEIRVKVRDKKGGESEWSDPLEVSMPKSRTNHLFIFKWLEQHPQLLSMLHKICR